MTKNKDMADIDIQIENIQKEIRETPYHKGTEHHIGRLRARIARLKDKELSQESKKSGGGGIGYGVKHQGDATIVLVGPPSVGKSTLLNKLTNAKSKVAPYAFTTVSVIPGMMDYKSACIQILDVPGLIEGAEEGKGRGREVLSVVRGSDLLVIMTDVERIDAIERIEEVLRRNGIRLNQTKPDVKVEKKVQGGLIVHTNIKQDFDKDMVKEIAGEFGIKNAEITLKEKVSLDRLIDSFSQNRVYIPGICVVNKIDSKDAYNSQSVKNENKYTYFVSAEKNTGLEEFKEALWDNLSFVTVYLVKEEEKPSFKNPIVMKNGDSLKDVLERLGSDFCESKRSAIIWGLSAKYDEQEVSLETKVKDKMKVRFI